MLLSSSRSTFVLKIAIFLVLLCQNLVSSENPGRCVMYGEFNETYNLKYDGEPKILPASSVASFIELCPGLAKEIYDPKADLKTCCSADQLETFGDKIKLLYSVVTDCQICVNNIRELTCNLICNPHQADYIEAYEAKDNKNLIERVKFAMVYEYAKGIRDSCIDVKFPNSVIPVTSFLCTHGQGQCTADDLIYSLFERSLFKIDHKLFAKNETVPQPFKYAFSGKTLKCNESYQLPGVNVSACSCRDCDSSCPPLPEIPKEVHYLLFNRFTIYEFVVLIVAIVFTLAYIICVAIYFVVRIRNSGSMTVEVTEPLQESPNSGNVGENELRALIPEKPDNSSFQMKMQMHLQNLLRRWGAFVASHKIVFIVFPVLILICLSCGITYNFQITTDPIDIWSAVNSEMRKEKEFFDRNFSPFYRTEQIIIKPRGLNATIVDFDGYKMKFGPAVSAQVIEEVFKMQEEISKLVAYTKKIVNGTTTTVKVTINDICFKPLDPYNTECAFFSVTQYFQNSIEIFNSMGDQYDWHIHLANCVASPGNNADGQFEDIPCLATFGAPVQPNLIFGAYANDPIDSYVLVITYVVENHDLKQLNDPAIAWERELVKLLKNYSHPFIDISFSTERSVEDEIDRQSHAEILTVGISYLIMFVYVTFALGNYSTKGWRNFVISQKIMLGFFGVILVLCSVVASVGFFSYLGFKVTIIVLEVLPFLTLAVGVDNIFLLVHEYERTKTEENANISVPEIVGDIVSKVGHGMTVSAIAQVSTFGIGAISTIPAVRGFSLFAAVALGVNFFMQITCFLALLAYDIERERSGRINVFCCFKLNSDPVFNDGLDFLEKVFRLISRVILHTAVRPIIAFIFILGWIISIYFLPSLQLGLDQTMALPKDSYLQAYFKDVFSNLRVGPPVYFIMSPGFDYQDKENQKKVCSGIGCDTNSLTSLVYYQSRISNYSKIALSADSWVDTYLAWLKQSSPVHCCAYKAEIKNNKTIKTFCPAYAKNNDDCTACFEKSSQEPTPEEFSEYLPWFLSDIPCNDCPVAGKATYGQSVKLNNDYYEKNDTKSSSVYTSRFMSYHTSLSKSEDFIKALALSQSIAKNISKQINHKVTTYSVFYIFYESYFTIWKESYLSFGISFVAVLIVNLLLYGFELRMSLLITFFIVVMNVTNAGFMKILDIALNPVSLVNLVMLIGINVEFLSHIGRAYLSSIKRTRSEKAEEALTFTGSSVFSGIALTKMLGVSILAFSNSQLFRVYYFKMYACAIVVGALHGLIALPVALSLIGPVSRSVKGPKKSSSMEEDPIDQEIAFNA